jgi:NAD-dependent SIR2 family protein deacetylase
MNYDCLVDDCLTRMGVQPVYGLEDPRLPVELNLCKYKMSFLKLHGSANWLRCDSEQCRGKTIVADGTPAKRLEYFYGQNCPHCHQKEVQPIIVPPTWAKGGQSGVLGPVWTEALRALREAGRIFIIGYSMPSTDAFFRYMLALALASNESLNKVIIVNPSAEAQESFTKLFQPQFSFRKLTEVKSTAEEYVKGYALATELRQLEHGFDRALAEESGFTIR